MHRIRRATRHRARPGFGHARDFAQTGRAGFALHQVKPVELKKFEALLLHAQNR
ncbi:hypothetical protein SAMN05192564_104103 [Paraburkholderia sartisoli]|uniref:Uncharacterized protein n=1 Tax=Paraburkholderia sartisoli TaxID=83784 RepID=A0A1H4F3T0_9BURK|nr:hypothetical protein SAMN05192564_104103 [Paraburkholderia sartisoli]